MNLLITEQIFWLLMIYRVGSSNVESAHGTYRAKLFRRAFHFFGCHYLLNDIYLCSSDILNFLFRAASTIVMSQIPKRNTVLLKSSHPNRLVSIVAYYCLSGSC